MYIFFLDYIFFFSGGSIEQPLYSISEVMVWTAYTLPSSDHIIWECIKYIIVIACSGYIIVIVVVDIYIYGDEYYNL